MNEESNTNGNNTNEESLALTSMLGKQGSVETFFESIWQEECVLFRWSGRNELATSKSCSAITESTDFQASQHWSDEAMQESPYEELIYQGWNVLVHLLAEASIPLPPTTAAAAAAAAAAANEQPHTAPLLFLDQVSVTHDLESKYNHNLMAAYLDGCNIVQNHADWLSPWIAALCQDLQKSFPHAYANVYITPPGSQAVRAHADDRDVLVIQVAGQKLWKVYEKVPIPYPYPHEQVGKDGLEVPPEVLEGPCILQSTLHPGDVLYMPRGHVHEAASLHNQFSFHVTVALATHDWTLAGILSAATQQILCHNPSHVEYRKAIPRHVGTTIGGDAISIAQSNQALQDQIQQAFALVQQQVTVQSINEHLGRKFYRHNHRAFSARMKLIHAMRFPSQLSPSSTTIVGPKAAKRVSLDSLVRAATPDEKASVVVDKPRGLLVREDTADAIIEILKTIKDNANRQRTTRQVVAVKDLKSLLQAGANADNATMICPLTLLSFARVCVEQGALALVYP